jgi:hypothetical protein
MMVVNLYVVFDKVLNECGPVFQAKNDSVALRQCRLMFQRENVGILDDFELYFVGSLDNETMKFVHSVEVPVRINGYFDVEVKDAG